MSRHIMRGAVHLITGVEGPLLLSMRKNTGYMDGYYGLIAGHMDGGESPQEAMIREAKEEADMNLDSRLLSLYSVGHVIRSNGIEYVMFFFEHPAVSFENLEPEKCDHFLWTDGKTLPRKVVPYIRDVLENNLRYFEKDERNGV